MAIIIIAKDVTILNKKIVLIIAIVFFVVVVVSLPLCIRCYKYLKYGTADIDFSTARYCYPLEIIDSESEDEFMFVFWNDIDKYYVLCDDSDFIKANKMDVVIRYIDDPTDTADLTTSRGSFNVFQNGIKYSNSFGISNWPYSTVYFNSFQDKVVELSREELSQYYQEHGIEPHVGFDNIAAIFATNYH